MKIENKNRNRKSWNETIAKLIWTSRVFHVLSGVLYGGILNLSYLNISAKDHRDNVTGFFDRVVLATRIAFDLEKSELEAEEVVEVVSHQQDSLVEGPSDGLLASDEFLDEESLVSPPSTRVEESKSRLKELFGSGELERILSPIEIAHMIAVESNGENGFVADKHLGEDPNLWAYGVLQVRKVYVDDVNEYCGTSIYANDCRWDPELSILVTQAYMNRYAKKSRLKRNPTFEDVARIHNGGPNGWRYKSTDKHWAKFKRLGDVSHIVSLYKKDLSI